MMNQANSLVYSTEKAVKDYGDKVSADEKANIEKELDVLKEAIKAKEQEKVKSVMESLQKISHKLAEEIYKASAAAQGAEGAAGPAGDDGAQAQGAQQDQPKQDAPKNDDVIDADFKAEDAK